VVGTVVVALVAGGVTGAVLAGWHGPSMRAVTAVDLMPVPAPFYVTTDDSGNAWVHDAATGRVTGELPSSPAWQWLDAASTASQDVFYLAASDGTFSRLVLTSAGRIRSLIQVGIVMDEASGVPEQSGVTGMATSPNGRYIAFAVLTGETKGGPEQPSQLEVLDLVTRKYTVYRTPAAAGTITALAWAPDGTRLCYTAEGTGNSDGVWLLELASHSARRIISGVPVNFNDGSALDGGDGGTVFAQDGRGVYTLAMKVTGGRGYLQVRESGAVNRTVFTDPHPVVSAVRTKDGVTTLITAEQAPADPLLAGAGSGLLVIDGYGRTYRIDPASARSAMFNTSPAATSAAW
jgi:hypothetical protein